MTCREKKMSTDTAWRLLRVAEGGRADLRPFRWGLRWFADLTERKTIRARPGSAREMSTRTRSCRWFAASVRTIYALPTETDFEGLNDVRPKGG